MATQIIPGMRVIAHSTISGDLPRRAVSGVVDGEDFPVVWVCNEQEWASTKADATTPDSVPWPAEDVHPAQDS